METKISSSLDETRSLGTLVVSEEPIGGNKLEAHPGAIFLFVICNRIDQLLDPATGVNALATLLNLHGGKKSIINYSRCFKKKDELTYNGQNALLHLLLKHPSVLLDILQQIRREVFGIFDAAAFDRK